MKKLVHSALSLCLVMALAVLGACASPTEDGATKEDGVTKESSSSSPEFAAWQNEEPFHGLDLAEFITLGAYKGITVYATRAETVETGDLAIFDFEGTAPGLSEETLAGMKAERYDQLYVGSGNFIPGFEEQMIGKKIGEAFKVNVTFPEDYAPEGEPQEELNGKEVTFQCVVHELRGKVASLATQAAYEKTKLINLPERETEMLRALLDVEAAGYDMSKEEYLQAIGGQEQWTAGIEEQLKQEMFIYAIAQKEGLEAAEKDMQTYFNNIRKSQGDESIKDEDIIAQHYCKNLLMRDLTKEKVIAFIGEQAKLS